MHIYQKFGKYILYYVGRPKVTLLFFVIQLKATLLGINGSSGDSLFLQILKKFEKVIKK